MSEEVREHPVTRRALYTIVFFQLSFAVLLFDVPEPVILFFGFGYTVCWLALPVVFLFDRSHIKEQGTDWYPSYKYLLALLPGQIGGMVMMYYLYHRRKFFESAVEGGLP